MTFLTNSTTCCVEQNYSAPAGGPWALIVLNYTGEAVGGVYDSSFRAYVDQVQVLFGTTPEYGIWFVSQDVTRYESLFTGTFNLTFLLGAALAGGYFQTSVSLWFYPVAAGSAAPSEPNLIVPIFHRAVVTTSTPTVYDVATIPDDVVNATLEMWAYGFVNDEFWYSQPQNYRDVYVAVNGSPIVAVLPFPYINTGGDDLFTWRPITAVFTLSDRPYEYDVTGALGMIEGTHNFTANVSGVSTDSNWLIGGALLMYTNASVGPATTISYRFSAPPPHYSSGSGGDSATAAPSYSYSSEIPLAAGAENVSLTTNESFSITTVTSASKEWSNLTGSEDLASQETIQLGALNYSVVRTVDFPLVLDLGGSLVITSTTGGTYPEYGNFTTYFFNGVQAWDESNVRSLEGPDGPEVVASTLLDDRFTGGDNIFAGYEELTSPTAALLLAITFISSSTTIDFSETEFGGLLSTTFSHELIGVSYQPPGPDNAETVLLNSVNQPLVGVLVASTAVLDVGGSIQIDPVAGGGSGPYTFAYSDVPPGCTASDGSAWNCTPADPGVYALSATVTDSSGRSAPAGSVTLVVNALPTVMVSTNTTHLDVGQDGYLFASASSGTGALECHWTVNGSAPSVQPCTSVFSFSETASARYTVTVSASDSLGHDGKSVTLTLVVALPPQIVVSPGISANSTVGAAVTFTATETGGSGNSTFAWFVNNSVDVGVSGPVLTFAPAGAGAYTVSVEVTDAAGLTAFAGPIPWTVRNAPVPTTPTSAGSSPSLSDDLLLLGLGAVLGAVVGVVALRLSQAPPGRRRS
jgi:Peptide N-acetyl-beta-D-glucosaminyl asparaginase amidase A